MEDTGAIMMVLDNLTLKCENRDNGCDDKTITVRTYNDHIKTCQFGKKLCPYCGIEILPSDGEHE